MSGLEVIGSVASVLQLAATVYSISKTLYEVGDALSNAPSDIKDLARDLETFSEELHLLSSLLDDKTHRYSDRVYRLTAKIIGDCASICVKIDRILRKLRSGSFLARVKWVFKEKEIMKLLARLRDLKLSLMGTLSLLSALKADHMMDAMGVPNPSLLDGPKDERLSKETEEELEETRRKLAGISAGQNLEASVSEDMSGTTLTASTTHNSSESQRSLDCHEKEAHLPSHASRSISSLATSLTSGSQSCARDIRREVEEPNTSVFISAMALPKVNTLARLPQAMESVQSFHSAFSRHDHHDLAATDTSYGNLKSSDRHMDIFKEVLAPTKSLSPSLPSASKSLQAHLTKSPKLPVNAASLQPISLLAEWRADMVESTMKRFNLTRGAAESWASVLPAPDLRRFQEKTEINEESPLTFEASEIISRPKLSLHAPGEPEDEWTQFQFQKHTEWKPYAEGTSATRTAGMPRAAERSHSMSAMDLPENVQLGEDEREYPDLNIANNCLPFGPDTGLNEIQHRRSASVHSDIDYQMRLFLTDKRDQTDTKPHSDRQTNLSPQSSEDLLRNEVREGKEEDEYYYRRRIPTDTIPGHWISDGEYSDGSDIIVRRRPTSRSDRQSRSPHHKRHLAEGALAGAGVAALLANSRAKAGEDSRGRNVVGGAALGAIGAQVITRARSRYRQDHESRSRSRSESSSSHSRTQLKTALGLAVAGLASAAAAKYTRNRADLVEGTWRGRSRTRSVSRRRASSSDSDTSVPNLIKYKPDSVKSHTYRTVKRYGVTPWRMDEIEDDSPRSRTIAYERDQERLRDLAKPGEPPGNKPCESDVDVPETDARIVRHINRRPLWNDEDESDLEAAVGLEAMRMAEEQDAQTGGALSSGAFKRTSSYRHQPQDESSDSDHKYIDLRLVGGGYDSYLSYGDDPARSDTYSYTPTAGLGGMTDYSIPDVGSIHPFPTFERTIADTLGTERPRSRRQKPKGWKTKKWVDAKPANYSGDDWGGDNDFNLSPSRTKKRLGASAAKPAATAHIGGWIDVEFPAAANAVLDTGQEQSPTTKGPVVSATRRAASQAQLPQPHATRNKKVCSRVQLACTECRRRRQRCDKSEPCRNCMRRYPPVRCTYDASEPTEANRWWSLSVNTSGAQFTDKVLPDQEESQLSRSRVFPGIITRGSQRDIRHTLPIPRADSLDMTSPEHPLLPRERPSSMRGDQCTPTSSNAVTELKANSDEPPQKILLDPSAPLFIPAQPQQHILYSQISQRSASLSQASVPDLVAQEVNGMVYYYDAAHIPAVATFPAYQQAHQQLRPQSYRSQQLSKTVRIEGMMAPSPPWAQAVFSDVDSSSHVGPRQELTCIPHMADGPEKQQQVSSRAEISFESKDQINDLWWRAFKQLQEHDFDKSEHLTKAWAAAHAHVDALVSPHPTMNSMARMISARLEPIISQVQIQLSKSPIHSSRSTIRMIDRYCEILKVMQETLNFKTGGFVWICLCTLAQQLLGGRSPDDILRSNKTFEQLSEVATLVARYNVLESMYQQWPGMSLETNYENSLVALCVHVLRYLDLALFAGLDSDQQPFEAESEALMVNIREADVACRGFSVTIVSTNESDAVGRKVEAVFADEDDSESTEMGEELQGVSAGLLPPTLPVIGN